MMPTRQRARTIVAIAGGVAAGLAALGVYNWLGARRAAARNPPAGRLIEIDGVQLHYVEKGTGPTVVLLHGNGAMVEDFRISGLFDTLSRSYRVVAFDRPGYGHSERPRGRAWTPQEQSQVIQKALLELGVSRATVIGHSWGALVALSLALDFPHVVRGLVLVSGYYFPSVRLDAALLGVPAVPGLGDLLRYTISPVLGRAIAWPLIRRTFSPADLPPRFRACFPVEMTLRPSQIRASAQEALTMVGAAAAISRRYRELDLPIVLLAGAGDRIVSVRKQAVRFQQEVRHTELHVLPGLGHMLHHAAPQRVLQAVETINDQVMRPTRQPAQTATG